jgi:RHS repeat-associated protein
MAANKSPLSNELLSAPKGGGAISGLGEAFQPNLNLGTGSYVVPIELPKGFRQRTPTLSLTYSTAGPQGTLGMGWALPIRGIRRSTSGHAPMYTDADAFLLDGTRLVHMGEGRYRPRIDEGHRRIRRLTEGWEVTEKDGTTYLLGVTPDRRESGPEGFANPLSWLVEEERDTSDNRVRYSYLHDRGAVYLETIEYAIYRVEFHYEERPDLLVDRSAGFAQETRLRCSRIELHRSDLEPSLLRNYRLEYVQSALSGHSLLASVTLTGFAYDQGPDGTQVRQETAPALRFEYTAFEPQNRELVTFDAQADVPPIPGMIASEVVDLEGNGLPGILQATSTSHRYWSNRGAGWRASQRVRSFPRATSLDRDEVKLADMNGDARVDLFIAEGATATFYPNNGPVTWGPPVFSRQAPQFRANEPGVRFLDADGDSVVDAVRSSRRHLTVFRHDASRGWVGIPRAVPRRQDDPAFADVDLRDPRVRIADLTGDGRPDWCRVFARAIEFWPTLGELRWDQRQIMSVPGPHPERFQVERCFLADLDGDGRADLLYLDGRKIFIWMNRGADSFAPPVIIENLPVADLESVRIGDFLGHGTTGLLFSSRTSLRRGRALRYVEFNRGVKPYLLSRIDNGIGGVTQIEYGYSTDHFRRDRDRGAPWSTSLPFPVPVVDRYVRTDVTTGRSLETEIRYHNGHFDPVRRKFVGFLVVETIERSGGESDARLTRHTYLRGARAETPELPIDHLAALSCKPLRTEQLGLDGSPAQDRAFRRESLTWTVVAPETAEDDTPILVPQLSRRRVEQLERQENGRLQEWEFEYDAFGNVTRERRRGTGGVTGADVLFIQTDLTYARNLESWVVNLVSERRVTGAGGELLALERFFYDGTDSNGLPLGETEAGLLRRHARLAFTDAMRQEFYPDVEEARLEELGYSREIEGDSAAYWIDERRVDYNARGSMVRTLDQLGQPADFEYDASGLFPERATNTLGHIRSATYDPWLGTIRTLTHWDGNQDRYFYDPLGHVLKEVRPGDTEELPTVQFEYRFAELPISTVMKRRRRSGKAGEQRSVVYYDGLGEELQRRAQAENDRFVVDGFEVRNLRGDVVRKEPPFFSTTEAFDRTETSPDESPFIMHYDALSRIVSMTRDGGHELRVVYRPDGATFFDPEDSDPASPNFDTPTIELVDAWEQTVVVVETGGDADLRTEFHRNIFGQVERVVVPDGSRRISYTYDFLQRKVRTDHADAGVRTFLFNARGQMVAYVDALGQNVSWEFDPIGRLLEVREQGELKESYEYDAGPGANLTHRLASVTDEAGSTVYSYDVRGRVARATRSFDGNPESFTLSTTHDPDGRLLSLTYPDGHEVSYDYNDRGLVQSVSGLFNRIEYDARGRRTSVTYDLGVTERFTYYADLGTTETHKVQQTGSGMLLYGRRYEYSRVLNVTAAQDLRAASPEHTPFNRNFVYDHLYRLRNASGSGDPHDYEYDNVDNLTLNGEFGPQEIDYEGARIRGPIIGGVTEVRYGHDANGCMIRRLGQRLTFDARQLLRSVERDDGVTVSFAYDHVGRRIRKRVTEQEENRDTLYIGEIFEVHPGNRERRFVTDPKTETRLVTVNGNNATLLVADCQGHIVLSVTAGGNEAGRRVYTAYGRTTVSSGVTADLGFGGRVLDAETGLYYFRRRYFDPDIGQFVSPDIIAVFRADELVRRPRSLHPYAYGNNSPVTFIDPFGLLSMGGWEIVALVVLVAAAVTLTILSAGALAPVLGVAVGTMYTAAISALAAGVIVGGLFGLAQGGWEGALVGALLGLSVVATVFIGAWTYGVFFGLGATAGFAIAGTLGGIQAAALIPPVRQNDLYKGILGWSSWINPWAWPGIAIGAFWFIVDIFGTFFTTRNNFPDVDFDPRYATVNVTNSSLDSITSLGGYSIGPFVWLKPTASADTPTHEAGHALNNALFGLLQASNLFQSSHNDAFWEILAESNVDPSVGGPAYTFKDLDWWG